jgi:glycosyltransferase involved in cell wall biosynthesis
VPEDLGAVFVIPPGHPPSGGDLYNRFLLRALRAAGFAFDAMTLPQLKTPPKAHAPGTEYWVDSLYIPALGDADPFGPEDRLFFIIHSLPSADPGLAPGRAEKLRRAEDGLLAKASGFLVTGPGTRHALGERGFAGLPILVVPPAPCVLPKGPRTAPDVFTGLIVSSLIRGKGVPEFMEELGREVRASDAFTIRIAGRTDIEPNTAAACLEAIEAHPLLRQSVRHLGFVPYEDLGGEYERSSALVCPSSSESFGMAFHEARAFGLPILAVRAPYSEPFIEDGRTGLLFENAAELAGGVLELVREPGRVEELAKAAASACPASTYGWADAARSFLSQRKAYGIFPSV